jgi:uncharacterized protein (TIGR03067 family)
MEGEWHCISAKMAGREDARMINATMKFTGNTLVVKHTSGENNQVLVIFNTAVTPPTVDLNYMLDGKKVTIPAIYELTGTQLRINTNGPGQPRPEDFSNEDNLMICERGPAPTTVVAKKEDKIEEPPSGKGIRLRTKLDPGMDTGELQSFSFSPDSARFAVAFMESPVQIWDVAKGEKTAEIEFPNSKGVNFRTHIVAWSPDGKLLAVSMQSDLKIYSFEDSKWQTSLSKLAKRDDNISALQWVGDNQLLITYAGYHPPGAVVVIDVPSGETRFEHAIRFGVTACPAIMASDGKTVAFVSEDNVYIFDASKNKQLHQIPFKAQAKEESNSFIYVLAFSPDGKLLAGAGHNLAIVWRLGDKSVETVFETVTVAPSILFKFTSDGTKIVVADGFIKVLDAKTGNVLMKNNEGGLNTSALAPDERVLISNDFNKHITVWDLDIPTNKSTEATPTDATSETDATGFRTWTSADGKFKIEAKLRSVINKVAQLEKADGTVSKVPIDKLSPEDQQFIADTLKK